MKLIYIAHPFGGEQYDYAKAKGIPVKFVGEGTK